MKLLAAFLVLLVVANADEVENMFKNWIVEYGKSYVPGTETYAYRLGIFRDWVQKINKHNSESHSWTMGVNKFTDLTAEEFESLYLTPMNVTNPDVVGALPNSKDWKSAGCVTGVKDQGNCGSCWAFSTTGGVEGCRAAAGKGLTSLSEQELVDCCTTCSGCNGGYTTRSFTCVQQKGLPSESAYPYRAVDGVCKSFTPVAHITGYSQGTISGLIGTAPVSVALNANWMQTYRSGIFCGTCLTSQNHAVLVTKTDATGGPSSNPGVYHIKNSWGTSWGESGYCRLCENHCGIGSAIIGKGCT